MPLPKKAANSQKYPLLTRWTAKQYLEIQRRAKHRQMSMMEYLERKVFDLSEEKHPAPPELLQGAAQ